MNTPSIAIVHRIRDLIGRSTYRLLLIPSAGVITFDTAQDASEWIAMHLPGDSVEWRLA